MGSLGRDLALLVAVLSSNLLLVSGLFPQTPLNSPTNLHNISSLIKNSTVVLIVIDALSHNAADQLLIPALQSLQDHKVKHSFFHSKTQSPTMTAQRVRAMMSGFNPNFIDFTSNFNSKTATEDNLLRILHLSGRKTLHMGDDTWKELYGPYLTRSFECQSFVVEDIDSCDSTVRDNLFREYLEGGWDFIVGHYLGVDHLGHTLSTNDHPRIRQKVAEIANDINKLIKLIDSNTVLLVTSDHGMLPNGNHGGVSQLQTSSFLLAVRLAKAQSRSKKGCFMRQLDLTATIAELLGVPAPANNKGYLVDLFESNECPKIAAQQQQKQQSRVNWLALVSGLIMLIGQTLDQNHSLLITTALAALAFLTLYSESRLLTMVLIASSSFRLAKIKWNRTLSKQTVQALIFASLYLSWYLIRNEDTTKAAMLLAYAVLLGNSELALSTLLISNLIRHTPATNQYAPNFLQVVSSESLTYCFAAFVCFYYSYMFLTRPRLTNFAVCFCAWATWAQARGAGAFCLALLVAIGAVFRSREYVQASIKAAYILTQSSIQGIALSFFFELTEGLTVNSALLFCDFMMARLGIRHEISSFNVTKAFSLLQDFSLGASGVSIMISLLGPHLWYFCRSDPAKSKMVLGVHVVVAWLVAVYNRDMILFLVVYAQLALLVCIKCTLCLCAGVGVIGNTS